MNKFKIILSLILLTLSSNMFSAAEAASVDGKEELNIDDEKAKLQNIKKFLVARGLTKQFLKGLMAGLEKSKNNLAEHNVTPEEIMALEKPLSLDIAKALTSDQVLKEMMNVSEKHLSPEELMQYTQFLESPLGKKIMSVEANLNEGIAEVMKAQTETFVKKRLFALIAEKA